MNLPPLRKKPAKPRRARKEREALRSPAHRRWVSQHECAVAYASPICAGRIEAHHVKTRGAGAGDEWCVSLCHIHHYELHTHGRQSFRKDYGVNLTEMARLFAERSPDAEVRKRAVNVTE